MLPDDPDAAHSWDMYQAAREIQAFIRDLTLDDFIQSPLLRRAVERDLEIMGEAARRVSESFRNAHPEIPWRAIIGQRNILSHDNGTVIPSRIWRTVTEDLPELVAHFEAMNPPGDPSTGHADGAL